MCRKFERVRQSIPLCLLSGIYIAQITPLDSLWKTRSGGSLPGEVDIASAAYLRYTSAAA